MNVTCPSIYVVNPDTTVNIYFDTLSNFHIGGCYVSWCGENIIRFTAQCTNNYVFEMISAWGSLWFPVSYKTSTLTNCDSAGYTCLTPFSSVWNQQQQLYYDKFYVPVTAGVTYDILIDYACANPSSDPPQWVNFLLTKPHVSNIQFYDITPDSISASWDGTFDDMVIEYGLKGFIPGNDTLPGINGTIVHNPVSPYTFYGLTPDSVYDFYFRDKCGVYSGNSTVNRKRIPNSANLSSLNCNTFFSFLYNANPDVEGAWSMDSCGTLIHDAMEKVFTFTPDTTGIYSFHHGPGSLSQLEIGIYYKDSLLGFNEHNWLCAGHGTNTAIWDASFGPLITGTKYLIMFKTNRILGAYQSLGFDFNCPSAICSTAPTGINSNATNNTICSGQSVTVTQIGGVLSSNGIFRWYADSCGGTLVANGYNPTLTPTDTITYYVRAEDSCGVTACASITINVNPSPAPPTITGINTFCQGGSTTLNAGAGYTCYIWSTATTTQVINVVTGGVYTVTVCNTYGCTASASVTVTVHPLPTAVITGTSSICAGQTANLTIVFTGTGPWNYSYNTPAGVVNATTSVSPVVISVNPSVTFNYTLVSVVDVYCSGTVSGNANITVYPLPTATISGNTSICIGTTAAITILFTGTPPFTFSYTDGTQVFGPFTTSNFSFVLNVNPLVTTSYQIISVTDAHCSGTASGFAIVTVNPLPVPVISGQPYFCPGGSTVLDAGWGYTSYLWSTGSGTLFITVNTAGVYTVYVTDANGCAGSASDTVTMVPNPPAVITPGGFIPICLGDTVMLNANTGTGYTYQWFKSSIAITGAVTSSYGAYATGFYTFDVTDSNSCLSHSPSALVVIVCLPTVDAELRTESELSDDIVLVPNPATNEITIQTSNDLQSIKIFDIVGKAIYQTNLLAPNSLLTKINISNFPKGIYFVEVNDGKEKAVRKFLKE